MRHCSASAKVSIMFEIEDSPSEWSWSLSKVGQCVANRRQHRRGSLTGPDKGGRMGWRMWPMGLLMSSILSMAPLGLRRLFCH